MDLLTFVAEIIKAAAWPVAAVVITLLFRKQFQALLGRMRKGKLGPAEFEFENAVRELQQEASELRLSHPPQVLSLPSIAQAAQDPRAVVMQAWVEVEAAMEELAKKSGKFNALGRLTSSQTVRQLQRAELLRPEQVSLFTELRFLRNRAAHDVEFNPSPDSVQAFARMAKELATEVAQVPNTP